MLASPVGDTDVRRHVGSATSMFSSRGDVVPRRRAPRSSERVSEVAPIPLRQARDPMDVGRRSATHGGPATVSDLACRPGVEIAAQHGNGSAGLPCC